MYIHIYIYMYAKYVYIYKHLYLSIYLYIDTASGKSLKAMNETCSAKEKLTSGVYTFAYAYV